MIEEWKSFTRYQKIVLSIYFLISLPLLPVMVILIPSMWWIAKPKWSTDKMTLMHFLCMSVTLSLFAYLMFGLVRWTH